VIAIGAPEKRLRAAQQMGADVVINFEHALPEERREAIMEATAGRGADVVIEASGSPAAVPEGLDLVRDNGTYVVVGQYTDHGPVEINPHLQINKKHVDIRGVWGIDLSHLYRAVRIQQAYNDRFHWQRLITHQFGLDEANEALEVVRSGRAIKAVIRP
jgi:L-iditol 2-dehydrogenase